MPELPDITVYILALEQRIQGRLLERILVAGPSLLRTANPPLAAFEGHTANRLRRIGKRIAIGFDQGYWMVIHLMIAGRLHWTKQRRAVDARRTLAAFDFDTGTLSLTETGSKKRASLHLFASEKELQSVDPGGIEVLSASRDEFAAALTATNHTLKRALTDPRLFSGIGNAYSDEILFHARLSPVKLTQRLDPEEITRLHQAVQFTLSHWTDLLVKEAKGRFPEKVTAFREEMNLHGKYRQPCRVCGTKIQRIRYASNETNYCPTCQTAGKLLADRALSRLLREDWPHSLDELEARTGG
jgi:formamidopyrimidine-DNA glycosylase